MAKTAMPPSSSFDEGRRALAPAARNVQRLSALPVIVSSRRAAPAYFRWHRDIIWPVAPANEHAHRPLSGDSYSYREAA